MLATAILNGMRTYLQATPPPGTQFAINAEKNKPERLASRKVEDSDDSSGESIALARVPRS